MVVLEAAVCPVAHQKPQHVQEAPPTGRVEGRVPAVRLGVHVSAVLWRGGKKHKCLSDGRI